MKNGAFIHQRVLFTGFAFSLLSLTLFASSLHAARGPIVRIIVVNKQTEAEGILSEINNGRSFASLAKEKSIDEKSKDSYGEIAETAFESLDTPLKEAALQLEEGGVSRIIPLGGNRYALVLVVDLSYYRRGAKAFRSKDFKSAETNLLKHVELNPDAVKARLMLAQIYEADNEAGKAEALYRDTLRFDSGCEDAYDRLGALYIHTGQFQQAVEIYDDGLHQVPNSKALKAGREKAKGHLALTKSQPPKKEIAKSQPRSSEIPENIAARNVAVKADVPKEKMRQQAASSGVSSKTGSSTNPQDSGDKKRYLRIILADKESDAQDILSQLKTGGSFALLARERSVDAPTREACGYLGEVGVNSLHASIREALSNLQEGQTSGIITMGPDRYAIVQDTHMSLYKEGEKAFIAGDLVTAEDKLGRYAELNPDAVKACTMLGKLYEDKGEFSKAIELYEQALSFGPTTVLVYERLARIYILIGMYQKARDVYIEGLRKTPSSLALQEGIEMADLLLIGRGEKMP